MRGHEKPEPASTEQRTETGGRRTAARAATGEPAAAWCAPSGAPRERQDVLAGQLQRTVGRRAQRATAQIARMLTPLADLTTNKHYMDKTLDRHSDGKRFRVAAVVRDADKQITAFKITSYDEDLQVLVTDPGFGWYGDKESKKAWDRLQAANNPAPTPAAAPAATGPTVKARETLTAYAELPVAGPRLDPDRDLALPAGAPPMTDTTTRWRLSTSNIKYSQNSISRFFTKATPSGAVQLVDAIAALRTGNPGKTGKSDTLEGMKNSAPLRLVLTHWGQVVSLDNRRLYVIKHANVGAPWVRWATKTEFEQARFHFTSTNKGKSVVVT